MTPSERLREHAQALLRLADEIDGLRQEPDLPNELIETRSALVPLKEAANMLSTNYDAVRKAARRANQNANIGGQSYVWRDWVDDRLSGVRPLAGQATCASMSCSTSSAGHICKGTYP